MSLEDYKFIYFWEYVHRFLGRVIGLMFIIRFFYFVYKDYFSFNEKVKYLLLLFLGIFQGLLGWYMVKSGLVDVPRVSPYRLTVHLIVAVAIYAYLFWTALGLLSERSRYSTVSPLSVAAIGITVMIVITILSG